MVQKKYTDGSGVSEIWLNIKNYVYSQLLGKADSIHTHTKSQITDFPSFGNTAGTICEGNDSRLSDARTPTAHTHVKSEITDFPTLATVATSGSYNDLSNKPTIPTVNDATLTIQKNGTTVKTFTANASSNVTANITVPTKTSELTNDSGFLTSHQSLSNYSTLANTIKSLSISGKTITYTKGDNSTGTLTTQDSNTWTAMVGATSSSNGSVGYVNAVPPKDGYNTKYLRADGTWQVPPDHTYNVYNKTLTIQKNGTNVATFTSNSNTDVTANISVPTKTSDLTNDSGFLTSHQDLSGYVPRSGGAVINGTAIWRTVNDRYLMIGGGTSSNNGGYIQLNGGNSREAGIIRIVPLTFHPNGLYKEMRFNPDGTWTWDGTACQITSDQRLKQQISQIDDKLLDAWEDVELSQFKYNDAVETKGDKARLHTGYVVQQIQKACESHGVDISAYGLFCHEEYPEETEEVEVEQKDGTKTKETKVIREANEHYSLRYTEALIVECKYLRRCIERLVARIEKLEKGNNTK